MITTIRNKQIIALLSELKCGLVELYGDRLFSMILFGSHARGEATSESDIDVMVFWQILLTQLRNGQECLVFFGTS